MTREEKKERGRRAGSQSSERCLSRRWEKKKSLACKLRWTQQRETGWSGLASPRWQWGGCQMGETSRGGSRMRRHTDRTGWLNQRRGEAYPRKQWDGEGKRSIERGLQESDDALGEKGGGVKYMEPRHKRKKSAGHGTQGVRWSCTEYCSRAQNGGSKAHKRKTSGKGTCWRRKCLVYYKLALAAGGQVRWAGSRRFFGQPASPGGQQARSMGAGSGEMAMHHCPWCVWL